MYIDLHSDTIFALEAFKPSENLETSTLCISAPQIRANHVWQALALYISRKWMEGTPWQKVNALHDRFLRELQNSGLKQMRKTSDLETGYGVILTTEEGANIEGDLSRLQILADWGVKVFGITWNHENELGYPCSKDPQIMGQGLKEKGIQAISECERLGIAIDVSHLSDGGFWDVVKYSRKPFFATHSNSRSVCFHQRNLTDEMLRALADKGGVTGLNFCPPFVSDSGKGEISALADHVQHIIKVAGEDVMAIGTDFDGFNEQVEVMSPLGMQHLFGELTSRGMSERILDKIRFQNAIRVFKDCEK